MTERFAMDYARQKASDRGFKVYRFVYQDLVLGSNESRELAAYNELWFLIDFEFGITVQSDFGICDFENDRLTENIHVHGDQMVIHNKDNNPRRVKFIQLILIS